MISIPSKSIFALQTKIEKKLSILQDKIEAVELAMCNRFDALGLQLERIVNRASTNSGELSNASNMNGLTMSDHKRLKEKLKQAIKKEMEIPDDRFNKTRLIERIFGIGSPDRRRGFEGSRLSYGCRSFHITSLDYLLT